MENKKFTGHRITAIDIGCGSTAYLGRVYSSYQGIVKQSHCRIDSLLAQPCAVGKIGSKRQKILPGSAVAGKGSGQAGLLVVLSLQATLGSRPCSPDRVSTLMLRCAKTLKTLMRGS